MPNLRSSFEPAVGPDQNFAPPSDSRQFRYPEPAGPELGYGPELEDRTDSYHPPVYGGGPPQQSFSKRGGSLSYGGVYPIGNQGRGGPGGPHPSGAGYGYNRPPPKGYNERASEDGGEEEGAEGGDYGSDYDEYDEPAEGAAPGGRQQQGGSNYGGNSEGNNFDYGDPVQNGNYQFSGQTQEGDDQGKDSGSHQYGSGDESGGYGAGDEAGGYSNGEESDNHVYGAAGSNNEGREYEAGEGGSGYGGDSGSNYNSESGTGESSGNNYAASSSDTVGFDGFY